MALNLVMFISIFYLATCSAYIIKFKNLKCIEFDPNFALFKVCKLRLPRRDTVALDIHVKLLQVPVNNISVNLSLLKRANGYKPFLYNITNNFCKIMKNAKQFPVSKIFFDSIKSYSNINHSCPYNHDIIVRDLILHDDMFKYFPLPTGEYMLRVKVAAYNDWKADVKACFELIERKL